MLDEVSFPVICVHQGLISIRDEPEQFGVASSASGLDGCWFVDASANAFRIKGATAVNEPTASRPKLPFGQRGVRLSNIELENLGRMDLEHVRRKLLPLLPDMEIHWEGLATDADAVASRISRAASMNDIYRALMNIE